MTTTDGRNAMTDIDLDAIEARAREYNKHMEVSVLGVLLDDVPALVAEVRELRAKVARVQGMHAASAISGCCRSCGQSTPCPTTRALAGGRA